MKFTQFREYRDSDVGDKTRSILDYLLLDMPKILRELSLGLTKLTLRENFESFEVTVEIPALTEVPIRNQLKSKKVPTQRMIVRGGAGAELVVDGATEWSVNYVYLKNQGAFPVSVTVVFMA